MDAGWVAALTALSVASGALLLWLGRHMWRLFRRTVHFLDDFFGQPERDGLPAVPGLMARLGSVEKLTADIAAELHPNSGHSLRDVVHRTASDVADIKSEQARLRAQVKAMQKGNP